MSKILEITLGLKEYYGHDSIYEVELPSDWE